MITTRTLYSYTWNSFAREIMMMMMADAFFRETKMTRATASLCAVCLSQMHTSFEVLRVDLATRETPFVSSSAGADRLDFHWATYIDDMSRSFFKLSHRLCCTSYPFFRRAHTSDIHKRRHVNV